MTRFQNEHLWHWLLVYFFAWNGNNPKTFSFHNSTLAHAPSFTFLFHFFLLLLWNTISADHFVFFVYFQIHKLEIGYGTLYSSFTRWNTFKPSIWPLMLHLFVTSPRLHNKSKIDSPNGNCFHNNGRVALHWGNHHNDIHFFFGGLGEQTGRMKSDARTRKKICTMKWLHTLTVQFSQMPSNQHEQNRCNKCDRTSALTPLHNLLSYHAQFVFERLVKRIPTAMYTWPTT